MSVWSRSFQSRHRESGRHSHVTPRAFGYERARSVSIAPSRIRPAQPHAITSSHEVESYTFQSRHRESGRTASCQRSLCARLQNVSIAPSRVRPAQPAMKVVAARHDRQSVSIAPSRIRPAQPVRILTADVSGEELSFQSRHRESGRKALHSWQSVAMAQWIPFQSRHRESGRQADVQVTAEIRRSYMRFNRAIANPAGCLAIEMFEMLERK